MDIECINQEAEKFQTTIEREAFIKGARIGFQAGMDKYLKELEKLDKYRINSTIHIDYDAIKSGNPNKSCHDCELIDMCNKVETECCLKLTPTIIENFYDYEKERTNVK